MLETIQGEDEEHMRIPFSNAFDGGNVFDDLRACHFGEQFLIDRTVEAFLSEVARVTDLSERKVRLFAIRSCDFEVPLRVACPSGKSARMREWMVAAAFPLKIDDRAQKRFEDIDLHDSITISGDPYFLISGANRLSFFKCVTEVERSDAMQRYYTLFVRP